jgi:DNA topoisomerase-3
MKKMVDQLVYEVRSNTSSKRISHETEKKTPQKTATKSKTKKQVVGKTCPKCKKGTVLKGKTAYGCSEYKNNCTLKIPFLMFGKKVSENQIIRLIDKGCTTNLKGFKTENGNIEGLVHFDDLFNLQLAPKKSAVKKTNTAKTSSDKISCPKCKKGTVLKGKTAYGCSEYKAGCSFVFTFDKIKEMANGHPLTKELVLKIISN